MSPLVRGRRLVVVLGLGLGLGAEAFAEMAHTVRTSVLRARPVAAGKTVDKVPGDTDLAVIDRSPDGKWVKVLFGDNEGWLSVKDVQVTADPTPEESTPPANGEPAPGTRPDRSEKKGQWVEDSRYHAGGAPSAVVVTAPAADLVERPREGARKVGGVKKGERLAISRASRDSAFYLVELSGGRTAWIASAAVAADKTEVAATRALPPDRSAAAAETAPTSTAAIEPPAAAAEREATTAAVTERVVRRRFHARAEAAFAIGQVDQSFTSDGSGPLTNYTDHSGLVGVDLGLQLDGSSGGPWFGGVAAGYRYGGGGDITARFGGLDHTLSVRAHDLEGLALFGYRAAALGGLTVSAHAGARMMMVLVDQSYTIPVPSERVLALQVGLGLEVPRLIGGLGVTVGLDWLPVGSRDQTANLGEGQDAGTSGYAAAVSLHYAFTDSIAAYVAGRYAHSSTKFDGVAERNMTIHSADRDTTLAGLGIGLRYTH